MHLPEPKQPVLEILFYDTNNGEKFIFPLVFPVCDYINILQQKQLRDYGIFKTNQFIFAWQIH